MSSPSSSSSSSSSSFLFQVPILDSFTQTPLLYYHVQYSLQSDFSSPVTIMVPYPTTTTNTPSLLNKGTVYYFRISVNNSAGTGPFSDTAMGRTAVDRKHTLSVWSVFLLVCCVCGADC